ncbi:MAG: AMP-binding protein, partial [Clostridia bacterium]|nr:AMP-binding protein [Clostridia bacterium]
MKLSFSTKGWHGYSFDTFCRASAELGFAGIELHNIHGPLFSERGGAFYGSEAKATLRKLYESKLSLPCIDALCNLSDEAQKEANLKEVKDCLAIAESLHIPALRLKAECAEDTEAALASVKAQLAEMLPLVSESGVSLLLQTTGLFANTTLLRDVLNYFACDEIAALWDFSETYRKGGEDAEDTIRNLGAYVRHVHVTDNVIEENTVKPRLVGEGTLPIDEMMLALRSVNYDGFVSLEWNPEWLPELCDPEIIFSHFLAYMKRYDDPRIGRKTLYDNKAHTGKFIWKKDLLINETFSQVLDRMVEEFPDQYAFKYTSLDYTRTYSQFRDDVDTFARALVSLGVKAGSHVSVWATNLPQWYIAFWATVKIGAVLVTVNTAYKIAEAEYLFRQ